MKAKIKEKREICKEKLYVEIDLLGQLFSFEPGQFFQLTLPSLVSSDERGNSRFFGFVNSPNRKESISMITRFGESAFKKSLMEAQTGLEVEIGSVGGHAVLKESEKPIVLIAGGIGIAPFMSVIRFAKEQSLSRPITLFYANKDRDSAVFLDELESYSKENSLFRFIPIMLHDESLEGEKNRIDSSLINKYLQNINDNKYFITGAKDFVLSVLRVLTETGIDMSNITIEIFTGY